MLVLDEVQVEAEGAYDVSLVLRPEGDLDVDGSLIRLKSRHGAVSIEAVAGQGWVTRDGIASCTAQAGLPAGGHMVLPWLFSVASGPGASTCKAMAIGDGVLAIEGLTPDPILLGIAGPSWGEPSASATAKAFILTSDSLALLGATRIQVGEAYIESSNPADIIIRPRQGRMDAAALTGTQIFLGYGSTRAEAELTTGQHWEHDFVVRPNALDPLRAALRAANSPPARAARLPVRALESSISARGPCPFARVERFAAKRPKCVGMDDASLAIGLADGEVMLHGPAATQGPITHDGTITAVASGTGRVLVGDADGRIVAFSEGGEPRWEFCGLSHRDLPTVTALAAYSTPAGPMVLVGTAGGAAYALDDSGRLRWARDQGVGSVRDVCVIERAGDDGPELGLCRAAQRVYAFDPVSGARRCVVRADDAEIHWAAAIALPNRTGLVAVCYEAGDVEAYSQAALRAALDPKLQCPHQWRVEIAGRPTNVALAPGNDGLTMAVGSDLGWLVWLTPEGVELSRQFIGARLGALLSTPNGLLATTLEGRLIEVSRDGEITAEMPLGGNVRESTAGPTRIVLLLENEVVSVSSHERGNAP